MSLTGDRPPQLLPHPPAPRAGGGDVVWFLLCAYLLLMAAAFAALRMPGAMVYGDELNVDRAVFTCVNAGTLTGFQLDVGAGQVNASSVIWPATMLGLTLGGAFFTLSAGGMAATRILRLPYDDAQVLWSSATSICVATLAGAAALLGAGRGLFDALLQSASAFANSGIFSGTLGGAGSWEAHLVLMPLALLGGLGLPVLMELYDRAVHGRPISTHARTVLKLAAWLYLVGTLLLLASRPGLWSDLLTGLRRGGWTARQSAAIRADLASSSVLAIDSRSAGFPFQFAGALPRLTQWTLVGLMAIGANSAGAGGGIKATTLAQLWRGVRAALSGERASRSFGIAASWTSAYFAIVVAGFACLVAQVPAAPADRLLFLSVSAVSNVGLSHDSISVVLGPLFTLSAMMLLGRLAPIGVLWWMARTTTDADLAVG